jgi:uncharacterized protein YkwD
MKCLIIAFLLMLPLTASLAQGPSNKSTAACSGKNGLTADAISELLAAHNKVRAQFKLPNLTWNCELADFAQQWATRGVIEHRDDSFYGESIFVSGSNVLSSDQVVTRWMSEQPFWDNKNAVCQAGKVCNHFTQIVWKKTARIGCGLNTNLSGRWKLMLVCNYDPAGNTPGPAY